MPRKKAILSTEMLTKPKPKMGRPRKFKGATVVRGTSLSPEEDSQIKRQMLPGESYSDALRRLALQGLRVAS
jgi:hypothetical protein